MNIARHNLSIAEFIQLFDAGELSLACASEFSVAPLNPPNGELAHSQIYGEWVLGIWSKLTGRASYDAEVDESFDVPLNQFLRQPFPFCSGNAVEVGNYLGAIAWFLRELNPRPGTRVIEYGSGWGHLALQLAMLGCKVSAIDLNQASAELLQARAALWGIELDVVQTTFLTYEARDCDLIVFFESFHHCAEPFNLLDRCRRQLRPGGQLIFLADAIYDWFYCPWGVRLDGAATYMARHVGWLELGFQKQFFLGELTSRGFAVTEHATTHYGAYGSIIVATLQ